MVCYPFRLQFLQFTATLKLLPVQCLWLPILVDVHISTNIHNHNNRLKTTYYPVSDINLEIWLAETNTICNDNTFPYYLSNISFLSHVCLDIRWIIFSCPTTNHRRSYIIWQYERIWFSQPFPNSHGILHYDVIHHNTIIHKGAFFWILLSKVFFFGQAYLSIYTYRLIENQN